MKNFARCLIILFLINCVSTIHAQEWIPYVPEITIVEQTRTSYVSQPVYKPSPRVIYQYVPCTVYQNVVIENQYMFRKTQTVVSRPATQWILQPVVIYQ
jgi:hypothetical protein